MRSHPRCAARAGAIVALIVSVAFAWSPAECFAKTKGARGFTTLPPGLLPADDIDVFYTYEPKDFTVPELKGSISTFGAKAPTTNTNTGAAGSGKVRFSSATALTPGAIQSWSVTFGDIDGFSIEEWYFTSGGAKTGISYKANQIVSALIPTPGGLEVALTVARPAGVDVLSITDFRVYMSQDPTLLDGDMLAFSEASLSGAPVAGIPESFVLDNATPTMTFTTAMFPGLIALPDSMLVYHSVVDEVDYMMYEVIPAPGAAGLTLLGLLTLARRRR